MTASPTTATPVPGATPAEGQGDVPPATTPETAGQNKKRRRKVVALLLLMFLFLGLLLLALWYLLFRQPLPLPPIPVTQIPHYISTAYGVDRPTGVAVTADGSRIFVAQSGTDRTVAMLDANGTKLGTLQPPQSTGTEHAPVYVAVDPVNGEVYVSDRPTGAIYIYNSNGDYQRKYTPGVDRPNWQPLGMTFDAAGNLYVVDLAADPAQVVEFDRSGKLVQTFGANDNLNFPNCVAVDADGNVYLTDSNNGRILVYDKTGKQVASVGRGSGEGSLGLPRGIAVDTQGHVVVVDTSGQAGFVYQKFSGANRLDYIGSFGSQGVDNGQFLYPTGLAADSHGHLYVADTANSRIQVWSY